MEITVGLIGLGAITTSHVAGLKANSQFRIVAVCDPVAERRERWSQQLACNGHAHHSDLIAQSPDAVVVALPHGLHCEVSVEAIKGGCHVVVEKPMAVSVNQCRQMLTAAAANRRALIVSEGASFTPGATRTGEKFAAGDLGQFQTGSIINARFYFHDGRPLWFLDPAMSGGGMFANVGLHRLAVARACLPGLTPASVTASVSYLDAYRVEACTSALVKYAESGAMIYEEVGYHARPPWLNAGTHFVFSEGFVSWDDRQWRLCPRRGNDVVEPLVRPEPDYEPVYANLARAMAGRPYCPHAWELAADTAIAQGAYASSREGREIDLQSQAWRIGPDLIERSSPT